ncbi:uncharacterized protein LOC100294644 [Nasonia vitripennis]|uniref:Rad21/Rec8-like protein N-terminal domain-containing protein n=2 Tax=Nasonia vitripennis TaxID=7425 RepID=A0A7M7HFM2_NASVI|nr:uncharacterized protein LOC100294644 [Nasonia vitripennis]
MFYTVDLLSLRKNKKGRLPRCWIAATVMKNYRKMSKEEIISVQVDCACEDIIEGVTGHEGVIRLSLYLAAQLSYGAITIFRDQVNYLFEECLKLLSLPSLPKKKKSKKTKAVDETKDKEVENSAINLPKDESPHILYNELSGVDIEKTFEGFDQTDRHQLMEVDESEVIDEPLRLPSLGTIIHFSSIPHETDIGEFIKNFPTVQQSQTAEGDMDQRAPTESVVEDNDPPATPKRTSQEAADNIKLRTPAASVVEDDDTPATPKRKSYQQHDETPKKRKRISTTETVRSPSHRSVRRSLVNMIETESIQANTAQTGNLDLPMDESSQEVQMPENDQRFSPPTESTGTQQMANRENMGGVLVNPIIEISEVSTIVADETTNFVEPSGLLRPEQPIIRAASSAPENQVQDNEQVTDRPQIQQPTIDQESEFILPELNSTSATPSASRRRRKIVRDENKQIKIRYVSDSNALDNIYTRTKESSRPDTCGKIPANSLLLLPSVGLKIGSRGNRASCSWLATILELFLNNIEKPCTNELDFEQLPHRDNFINKRPRGSGIQGMESTVEPRSKTPVLGPCSPSHSQRQIDQQLMPPPLAPASLVHSHEYSSPRPPRGFPESMEPTLAVSPRQVRQRSQPSAIEPDVPQTNAALPTDESVIPPEADQAGVEAEAPYGDMPMPINEPVVEPPEAGVVEVQTKPPNTVAAMSEESFLAGVRWQRLTKSAQNETEDTLLQSTPELFITPDEFHELLRKLWEVMMEFGEPPRLSFDDVFIKGEISVLEVLRYFKYLFEFEQKQILRIEEVSLFENYICKLEEIEVDEN